MMSPDHKFDLMKSILIAVPALVISLLVFLYNRRQTKPRLDVLISPVFVPTVDDKSVLADEWPGIVVRNQSAFPLRICNVGFCVGKKFFEFGRPLGADLSETSWPYEIAPRTRIAFYFNERADYGGRFKNAIKPELKDQLLWEVARGYAMTECAKTFTSRKLSSKSKRMLKEAAEKRSKAFPLAEPNPIIGRQKKT
jgi:hypothetical protein